jgi:hypothetical protein
MEARVTVMRLKCSTSTDKSEFGAKEAVVGHEVDRRSVRLVVIARRSDAIATSDGHARLIASDSRRVA